MTGWVVVSHVYWSSCSPALLEIHLLCYSYAGLGIDVFGVAGNGFAEEDGEIGSQVQKYLRWCSYSSSLYIHLENFVIGLLHSCWFVKLHKFWLFSTKLHLCSEYSCCFDESASRNSIDSHVDWSHNSRKASPWTVSIPASFSETITWFSNSKDPYSEHSPFVLNCFQTPSRGSEKKSITIAFLLTLFFHFCLCRHDSFLSSIVFNCIWFWDFVFGKIQRLSLCICLFGGLPWYLSKLVELNLCAATFWFRQCRGLAPGSGAHHLCTQAILSLVVRGHFDSYLAFIWRNLSLKASLLQIGNKVRVFLDL